MSVGMGDTPMWQSEISNSFSRIGRESSMSSKGSSIISMIALAASQLSMTEPPKDSASILQHADELLKELSKHELEARRAELFKNNSTLAAVASISAKDAEPVSSVLSARPGFRTEEDSLHKMASAAIPHNHKASGDAPRSHRHRFSTGDVWNIKPTPEEPQEHRAL
ncbi:hypothetical protein HDU91_004819 [Kappamyces sp. JEL0680]|nr:hypothetical protein HDU91_004819 [Kappamyces sp. JEL0680]